MISLTTIECPICHKIRFIPQSHIKYYIHKACHNCKNIFTARTRFDHILWFWICITSKTSGPFKTREEAKNNKPEWRCNPILVSFNIKTNKGKTVKGIPLDFYQNEVLKGRI